MNLPKEVLKARLADRYTAAELADAIELDASLFLDYFLEEVLQHVDVLDIEETIHEDE